MLGRLIQALIFLSSRSSESDKSYKNGCVKRRKRNVKPGIFTYRPPARINFTFLQDANRSIFSMTALRAVHPRSLQKLPCSAELALKITHLLLARKSCLNFPFYPKNTNRKSEGKESQVQPKNCLDFEFGS